MQMPLLLLTGLLSNDNVWKHQMLHLCDVASIQIISSSANTPEEMVQSILDAAPPQFALAGHSMGGWLCLEIMRVAASRVSKLCLLNTTYQTDSTEKLARRKGMVLKAESGQFHDVIDAMVEKMLFNQVVKNDVRNMFLGVGSDVFICQQQAMMKRGECHSILSKIRCPTLVVHAMQDQIFSLEEHEELAALIPGAKLALVEDCGHMSPIEMPQAITALLRLWLSYF